MQVNENSKWLPKGKAEDALSDNDSESVDDDLEESVSSGLTNGKASSSSYEQVLAGGETRAVHRLRILTFVVLIVVAVLASVGVYLYTERDEQAGFTAEFSSHSNKVIGAFQADSYRKLQALYSLSSSLTAYGLDRNESWPFVTVENSAQIFGPYLSLADATAIILLNIVPKDLRDEWEFYSVDHQHWIDEDLMAAGWINGTHDDHRRVAEVHDNERHDRSPLEISPYIRNYVGIDTSPGDWIVWWQYAPVIRNRWFVNFNRLAWKGFAQEAALLIGEQEAVLSEVWRFEPGLDFQSTRDFEFTSELLQASGTETYEAGEPLGYIYYPVFESFEEGSKTVSILSATVYWRTYFEGILPDNVHGLIAVVKNSAGQAFTYKIDGKVATFLGMEDLHERQFDEMTVSAEYSSFAEGASQLEGDYNGVSVDNDYLSYSIHVYPSAEFQAQYLTTNPAIYTAAMVIIFVLTAGIFIMYDCYVERRQKVVMTTAARSTAVVKSLFPENVRDRLMEEATPDTKKKTASREVQSLLDVADNKKNPSSRPIADFFPETTVMFADIRGFTAWCSTREPAQVFLLLETVYNAFDAIAERRRVFKVETVGDCYMAVCGVPTKRKEHAVIMARFARDCLYEFNQLVHKLELTLGPDTADLGIRIGLNSGAVTGGVIRAGNARFQLFGDTVNTAARMESTGVVSRVQMSQDTVDLLIAAGKTKWFKPREDKVLAKGKGELQTYWLVTGDTSDTRSTGSGETSASGWMETEGIHTEACDDFSTPVEIEALANLTSEKMQRLVQWNVELLARLLKQIVARRNASGAKPSSSKSIAAMEQKITGSLMNKTIEEVEEVITLPSCSVAPSDEHMGDLSARVAQQLEDFVRNIAALYRNNRFHNFEHASHVTMSVAKLLSRIVAPSDVSHDTTTLHDHTYGITSDPLTQFACVFSALVHDVDHYGVPNSQLVKENDRIAQFYEGKSVAEQNSVDLAWNLLMDDSYNELRSTIYATEPEMTRFRQLVVNSVMATDIVDKDLKALRNARWERAFAKNAIEEAMKVAVDRKATIVIEHLIQASDVAHTMQHWHIYRKWNERFFIECYTAYKRGRADQDPSKTWYEGELGFFDLYIIPLAKKLKECGVFGVSSDEYLNYAVKNREEWKIRGREVVESMVELVNRSAGSKSQLSERLII